MEALLLPLDPAFPDPHSRVLTRQSNRFLRCPRFRTAHTRREKRPWASSPDPPIESTNDTTAHGKNLVRVLTVHQDERFHTMYQVHID